MHKLTDVFVTAGLPTLTYVKRDHGAYEQILNQALDEGGQLCLITGPSKTGKTTLYRESLKERGQQALTVSCSKSMTCEQVWLRALEGINFERVISTTTTSGKNQTVGTDVTGKSNLAWIAEFTAKISGSTSKVNSESEARERILSKPTAQTLAIALHELDYVLVIEDFHYLSDDVKVELFQQWKTFVDNRITVLVIETSHRAVDIAKSNRDLIGRITHIDIDNWKTEDLQQIINLGFKYLNQPISEECRAVISKEAVGLPIIVQQTCLQLFSLKNITLIEQAREKRLRFNDTNVREALHQVAKLRYSTFESAYNTLVRGPREKSRVYKTYEIVLGCFSVDPIKFALSRSEIDKRIRELKLDEKEMPPAASVNSTLGALKKFQDKRGLELLEWRTSENMLYILEPIFLYYVRWRRRPAEAVEQLNFFDVIFASGVKKVLTL